MQRPHHFLRDAAVGQISFLLRREVKNVFRLLQAVDYFAITQAGSHHRQDFIERDKAIAIEIGAGRIVNHFEGDGRRLRLLSGGKAS